MHLWHQVVSTLDDNVYWPPLKGTLFLLGQYIIQWTVQEEKIRDGTTNLKNGVLDFVTRSSFTSLLSASKAMYEGSDKWPFENGFNLWEFFKEQMEIYATVMPTMTRIENVKLYKKPDDKYVGISNYNNRWL